MPRCAPVVLAVALWVSLPGVAPAGATTPPPYRPPVDAPVTDPFRAPKGPYGPGNRGLEFGTAPGAEVRSAAAGVVTFAGLVAGSRHVVVLHADGVRTSYSFLAQVDVRIGQHVGQGAVVGTTVARLHFGARRGDAYFDPASLFAPDPPQVHLVPFDDPPGGGLTGERRALRQLVAGLGGVAADAGEWLRVEGGHLVRTGAHYLERTYGPLAAFDLAQHGLAALAAARRRAERPCTPASAAAAVPSGDRRVALLVGGLGSTSDDAAIDDLDTATLGYAVPDVVRFSYLGGRTPDPTDGFDVVTRRPYDAASTQGDLRQAGARLADLVEDLVAAAPGVAVDLYAHSQGGLVARLALAELERRHGAGWLDRVGLLATIGTPHGGADLATAVHAVGTSTVGSLLLDGVAAGAHLGLDAGAVAVGQLAETSELVAELARTPLPPEVPAISIAARGDLVVPVPRTRLDGATEVVVPVVGPRAHDALPGSAAVTRELALARAGRAPGCQALGDALLDEVAGEGLSRSEDLLGALAWAATSAAALPLGG